MKGRSTYVLSMRVPDGLYTRVRELADKRGLTVSDWLKGIVATATKYHLNNDSGASHQVLTACPTEYQVLE